MQITIRKGIITEEEASLLSQVTVINETFDRAIEAGKDPHTAVAERLKITRQRAKSINFARMYGAGPLRIKARLSLRPVKGETMFACGYLLQDGSQCLHVSRRKALACVERGRLVDFANQANKEKWEAQASAAHDRNNMIRTNDLLYVERAKVAKLEASIKDLEAKIQDEKTAHDSAIAAIESTLEGVRAERDAFVNAAVPKEAVPVEANA